MPRAGARLSRDIAIAGAAIVDAENLSGAGVPYADEARLRRMDRFGRAGFLAGSAALVDARFARTPEPAPRVGLVVGTAFGCRDAVTRHAHLLAETAHTDELSPSLFTQTVHNTVAGELAIEWRIGGIAEVLVSGRTGGLEALLRGASHLAADAADAVVVVGAEGLHPDMESAWSEERRRYGVRGADVPCADGGAGLLLVKDGARAGAGRILGGTTFFETDAGRVAPRLAPFLRELAQAHGAAPVIVLASPALDGAFERAPLERAGLGALEVRPAPRIERFGAAGTRAVVELLRAGVPGTYAVVVRDPDGPVAAAGVLIPRSA